MYTLVCLTSQEAATEEGRALQHAVGAFYPMLNAESVLLYSVRQDGKPLLTLSACYDERGAYYCEHVVGLANRRPTEEELEVVRGLLRERKIALRYNPESTGLPPAASGPSGSSESRDWDEVPTPVRRETGRRPGPR